MEYTPEEFADKLLKLPFDLEVDYIRTRCDTCERVASDYADVPCRNAVYVSLFKDDKKYPYVCLDNFTDKGLHDIRNEIHKIINQ